MTDAEIRKALQKLPGWVIHKGRLEKAFVFQNFSRAAVFFNKMVNPIEERQHYPHVFVAYNRVVVSLFSPEAGRLTEQDFDLAADIEALAV